MVATSRPAIPLLENGDHLMKFWVWPMKMTVTLTCRWYSVSCGKLLDELVVPWTAVTAVGRHSARDEAISDWLYWLKQGGQLVDPEEAD